MVKSKKISSIITAMSVVMSLAGNSISVYADEISGKTKQIDIVSFNDFHGSILENGKDIGAAKLTTVIKDYKQKDIADDTYGVLAVSGGDNYQGSAMSNLTYGAPVTDMLMEMGIEASAIGNHEYDWGSDKIKSWGEQGNFEFVAANVVNKATGNIVDYAVPYVMSETEGVNVAFIGIATPETLTATKSENVQGVKFLDAIQTLDQWAPIAREAGADVIIALTHCGATNDAAGNVVGEAAEIAEKAKDIDGVVAAHNHLFTSGVVNGRPVVEGGKNGRGLGIISLTVDENKKVINATANTRKLYEESANITPDETVAKKIAEYENNMAPILNEKVTDLKFDLPHDRYAGITPLGVQVSEAMRKIGKTQIGIANGGGIRTSLSAGDLTVGDMYTILPFDNQLVTLELKGADLKEVIEHGINPKSFGWGQFAGLKVWYDTKTDKVTKMQLEDGTEIEDDKYYSVTTIDFLITGGDSYDFSKAINVKDTFEVMREGIQAYWKANGISPMNYDLLIGVDQTETPGQGDEPQNPETPTDPGKGDKPQNPGTSTTPGEGDQSQNPIQGDAGNKKDSVKVESDNKDTKSLPKTGSKVSSASICMLGLTILGVGAVVAKKREKRA